MKKYLWLTDTHLNFALPWALQTFVERIQAEQPDCLILTGDIACGISINSVLETLSKKLHIPIYFVLGNHDFYSSSFVQKTQEIIELCKQHPNLFWITQHQFLELNKETALIGEEGWYDARLGNPIYVNYNLDWIMIEEFNTLKTYQQKLELTRQLADKYTSKIIQKLEEVLPKYKTIYVAVHVPPWKEATRDLGTPLEKFWLPYNVNFEMGKQIEKVMSKFPKNNVIVLAGHVHANITMRIACNIECQVGDAKYLHNINNKHILYI